jgi:hypothetical protein
MQNGHERELYQVALLLSDEVLVVWQMRRVELEPLEDGHDKLFLCRDEADDAHLFVDVLQQLRFGEVLERLPDPG